MLLQKLLWNDSAEYGPNSLYFREEPETAPEEEYNSSSQGQTAAVGAVYVSDSNTLRISAGSSASFDTYFNMFSVSKWAKYTRVRNFGISAVLKGKGTIALIPAWKNDQIDSGDCCDKTIKTVCFENDFENTLDLGEYSLEALAEQMDCLYINVAAETDVEIISIEIFTAEQYTLSQDSIACCICTYKREKELTRNIEAIKHDILENSSSLLYGKLKIFISDNGHTLAEQCPELASEDVKVFRNPNYGGSGGFTRCMIESVIKWTGDPFGYCILMDDDIVLYPDILIRAYSFLSALKEEYNSAFLEGTHMLVEEPSKAYEGKLTYSIENDCNIYKDIKYYDFSDRAQLYGWSGERSDNIYGWWFTCIPAHVIKENNLPLPLFFQLDDYEFGVRNKAQVILLNGVGVWHPNPVGKQPYYTRYYIARNNLMMGVSTGVLKDVTIKGLSDAEIRNLPVATKEGNKQNGEDNPSVDEKQVLSALRSRVSRNFWGYTWRYQYDDLEMLLRGYRDFFRGPDYFKSKDPEKLHKRLLSTGAIKYEDKPIAEPDEIKAARVSPKKKMIRYLLPSKGRLVISKRDISSDAAVGFKEIVIVESENKYYVVKKDLRRSFKLFLEYVRLIYAISKDGSDVWNKWKSQIGEIRSYKFWESYFGHKNS